MGKLCLNVLKSAEDQTLPTVHSDFASFMNSVDIDASEMDKLDETGKNASYGQRDLQLQRVIALLASRVLSM
jgi:hypothetical protein